MPRHKTELEKLLSALEIPDCGCKLSRQDDSQDGPESLDEPAPASANLGHPVCKHAAQAGKALSWHEWRELLDAHLGKPSSGKPLDLAIWQEALEREFGRLPYDHAKFHGEPPLAPNPMRRVASKEGSLIVFRDRDSDGYALRHPGDYIDPRVVRAEKIARRAGRTPGNHSPFEAGLDYRIDDETGQPTDPDELMEQVWQKLFEDGIKHLPYSSIMKWTPPH